MSQYLFRAFLGLVTASVLQAQNYPDPAFLPPAGHPRVYFTANDLPRLRSNSSKPQNSLAWAAHLKNLEQGTTGLLKSNTNPDSRVLATIESYAFDYALRGNQDNGRKAISALRNYLDTVVIQPRDYNNAGQTVFTIAIVYDWCFPLLDAAARQSLYRSAIANAGLLEVGWPPVKEGDLVGHGPEGQVMRDLMSAAIAMYDEHPEMYRIVAGRFFGGMTGFKRFVYPAHAHPMGSHYGTYRGQWEMLATWIFGRIGLPEVFGPDQRWFLYWMLYARRPDGQFLRDGDTHINNIRPGAAYTEPARPMFLAANYFSDPYLKEEAMRETSALTPSTPTGNQSLNPVEILIFNDPDLAPRPLDELPLTHYFPSPKGAIIARTGWREGAVIAEMKIDEWYYGNHMHLDAGAFQIYYHGALATDSGYYQAAINTTESPENKGSSGYGSAHDYNYNKRSIAHNTVTVYDPDERFSAVRWKSQPLANDGGQRLPNNWIEPQHLSEFLDPKNGYRIGEVLGHGIRPGFTYLHGDLTHAYSAKIRAYERSFVFLDLKDAAHPAALIVFDRVVSSNAKFRKVWLLHGLEKPQIIANQVVFKDTRPGYTGKLTLDALIPAPSDTQITAIGGPGKEAWVDGTNYPALTRPQGNNEGGGWRVEVSPRTARETDYFLNILQMGGHSPDVPALPVQTIETANASGLRISDRIVLFAKTPGPIACNVTGGPATIIAAGLAPGRWTVERNGQSIASVTVSVDAGFAYFAAETGAYRLYPAP